MTKAERRSNPRLHLTAEPKHRVHRFASRGIYRIVAELGELAGALWGTEGPLRAIGAPAAP